MAEDGSSDFTFCQVSSPVDQFQIESPKALSSLQKMKLDEPSNEAPNGLEGSSLNDNLGRQMDNSSLEKLKTVVVNPSSSSSSSSMPESGDATTEKKPLQKKTVRAKVPFEKGFSQMDWMKLTRTDPDLAGVDMLLKAAGKDCTSLFNKYHAWVNAEFLLEKCLVGFLDVSE